METVTVSPKFHVVIPKEMREALKLIPGQKVQALLYENRMELIPVRPVKQMRGSSKELIRPSSAKGTACECSRFLGVAGIPRGRTEC